MERRCTPRSVSARSSASSSARLWGLIDAFGPAPLGRDLELSKTVLDRHGRLLRSYTTSEGRWRLPASRADVDPRFLEVLFAYEDKRFWRHSGVDPLAMARAAFQLVTQGQIVSGGSTITMQVARLLEPRAQRSLYVKLREMVRALAARARARQGRDPLALSHARALWRQSRRHQGRLARLFRQGAAAADARRGGAARGAAAIAGAAPARPLS